MDVDPSSDIGVAGYSSPGINALIPARDLHLFEDESELIGGVGEDPQEVKDDHGDEPDYRAIPALDQYKNDLLHISEVTTLFENAFRAAGKQVCQRDREEGRPVGRKHWSLLHDESEDGKEESPLAEQAADAATAAAAEEIIQSFYKVGLSGYSVQELVSLKRPRIGIYNTFKNLLKTVVDNKRHGVYQEKIGQMCENNQQSFEVDFYDLALEPILIIFLTEIPVEVLKIFDEAAKEVVLSIYPQYEKITSEIHIRITNFFPLENIGSLSQCHLNQFIRTSGVVTSVKGVLPEMSLVKYDCIKCNSVLGPYVLIYDYKVKPDICPECQSNGPFQIHKEQTVYKNYQRMTIQEISREEDAGCLPLSKDAILLGDLCDVCKPGDEVELTGIYSNSYDGSLNTLDSFPVFVTVIIANHVAKKR